MLNAQTSTAAKSMVEMNIIESRRRLEFLEGELKKLSLKAGSGAAAGAAASAPQAKPLPAGTIYKRVSINRNRYYSNHGLFNQLSGAEKGSNSSMTAGGTIFGTRRYPSQTYTIAYRFIEI